MYVLLNFIGLSTAILPTFLFALFIQLDKGLWYYLLVSGLVFPLFCICLYVDALRRMNQVIKEVPILKRTEKKVFKLVFVIILITSSYV